MRKGVVVCATCGVERFCAYRESIEQLRLRLQREGWSRARRGVGYYSGASGSFGGSRSLLWTCPVCVSQGGDAWRVSQAEDLAARKGRGLERIRGTISDLEARHVPDQVKSISEAGVRDVRASCARDVPEDLLEVKS